MEDRDIELIMRLLDERDKKKKEEKASNKNMKVTVKFDGSHDETKLDNWIKAVELFQYRTNSTGADLTNAVIDSLEGRASAHYTDNMRVLDSWEKIRAEFEKLYRPLDAKRKMFDAWYVELVQGENEDMLDYAQRFTQIRERFLKLSLEEICLERFVRGMTPKVRMAVQRSDAADYNATLELAVKIWGQVNSRAGKGINEMVDSHQREAARSVAKQVETVKKPWKSSFQQHQSARPMIADEDSDVEMLNTELGVDPEAERQRLLSRLSDLEVNFGTVSKGKCFFCGERGHVKGNCKYGGPVCLNARPKITSPKTATRSLPTGQKMGNSYR